MPGNWDNPAPLGEEFGSGGGHWERGYGGRSHRGSGGSYGRSRGESSFSGARERKYSQKIYVDGLFPPHVRPASVLIGTRGSNHNRMQASGCTVQLRGKGCSQVLRSADPSSQRPDEPVHLLVKYDTPDQFERFKDILREIVDGYESQAPRRFRPPSSGKQSAVSTGPPAAAAIAEAAAVVLPNWDPCTISDAVINSEGDFLWLLKVYLVKEQSAFLDEIAEGVAVFFCVDSIEPQLSLTSIPPGPHQLRDFIRSCPHVVKLILEPGVSLGPNGDIPVWSRPRVSLAENIADAPKDALKELHRLVRREQAQAAMARGPPQQIWQEQPGFGGQPVVGGGTRFAGPLGMGYGRTDLPSNTITLMVQALHCLISETPESSFVGLEDRFFERFKLPLKTSAWGYQSVVAFVKAYPSAFRVSGSGREMRVEALPAPDFSPASGLASAAAATSPATGYSSVPPATSQALWPMKELPKAELARSTVTDFSREIQAIMAPLREARPAAATSAATPPWQQQDAPVQPKPTTSQMSVAQKAPRLLGILSKLPRIAMNR